ncbi:MAG: molybdopterin synthase sulfur carrier subunit [Gammaproteobacteria bacterium]|nr:molybdopterin synthase sulfur carrier subunit [Gammaproteobacteria bacterium]
MLTVQFLARYREELNCESEQLPWQEEWQTIEDVRQFLAAREGVWAVLNDPRIMCARNQDVCSRFEPIQAGDELALFPMVTGG